MVVWEYPWKEEVMAKKKKKKAKKKKSKAKKKKRKQCLIRNGFYFI